jgi:hypothetical protein
MSETTPVDAPPARRQRPARHTLAASVLTLEAFVVFFAALVAFGLRLAGPGAIWATAAGLVAVIVVSAALLRRGIGYALGSAVQVWLIALGVVLPAMFVLGALFAVLWVVALRLGGRIDREREAYAGYARRP